MNKAKDVESKNIKNLKEIYRNFVLNVIRNWLKNIEDFIVIQNFYIERVFKV